MNNYNSLRDKVLLLGAVVLVVVGIFFYTKYKQNVATQPSAATQFQQAYKKAQTIQNVGDNSGAIEAYNTLLKDAPNKSAEGKLKILTVASLVARNQGDDVVTAAENLKSVYNDSAMPADTKALALNAIANFIKGKDVPFYTSYFSEEPFASLLPDTGTDAARMSTVYLELLKLSDKTYPNSQAEYLIAGNYYAPLIMDKTVPKGVSLEQAASLVQTYVSKADENAPNDESTYKSSVRLENYFYRARALEVSAKVLNNIDLTKREDAFKLVLSKGELYETDADYYSRLVLMRNRFNYANFLDEHFTGKRNADIIDLLRPFEAASSATDQGYKLTRSGFTATLVLGSGNAYVKSRAAALAKVSPEFKAFLESIGFKF